DSISQKSGRDVAELVARLGGEEVDNGLPFDFSYAEILGILQALTDMQAVSVDQAGQRLNAAFVLQDVQQSEEAVYEDASQVARSGGSLELTADELPQLQPDAADDARTLTPGRGRPQ